MQSDRVIYHSQQWEHMVEQGWITWTVDSATLPDGNIPIAEMRYFGVKQ